MESLDFRIFVRRRERFFKIEFNDSKLIEYVVQDEMIKTTRKLDNFMDWNLLNQNNYQRVLRVLGVAKDE